MKKPSDRPADPLTGLRDRPGFLIRRAHQISQSVFTEECGGLDITSTQFGVLWILSRAGELDQIGIARLLGFDRSTTALVVKLLQRRGLIAQSVDKADRRRYVLRLTKRGKELKEDAEPLVDKVRTRLESPFTADEAKTFLRLLEKFTRALDETARAPLDTRSPSTKKSKR